MVALRFKADLLRLARDQRGRFQTYPPAKQGYEPWEAGSAFLWDYVHDHLTLGLEPMDGLKDLTAYADPDITFRWSEAAAQELSDRLGMRPLHPGERPLFEEPKPIERPHEPMWVTGAVRATMRFEADPVVLAAARPDHFAKHPPAKQGHEPWEAVSTFVAEVVYDALVVDLAENEALQLQPESNEASINFRWTEEMAAQFDRRRRSEHARAL